MEDIFLIFGYGIPKDIFTDENYNFYLKVAFNKIYDLSIKSNGRVLLVFCGGKTDMHPPYRRTEADEMKKFFSSLIKQRPFLKPSTKNWRLIRGKASLSTLENLINSKMILADKNIRPGKLNIICEQTRAKRVKLIASKVFKNSTQIKIIPVDFDVSAARYLAPEFLDKREKAEIKHSLWALKNPENLKKHHQIFNEKIEYLRKEGSKASPEALKKWWDDKLSKIDKYGK